MSGGDAAAQPVADHRDAHPPTPVGPVRRPVHHPVPGGRAPGDAESAGSEPSGSEPSGSALHEPERREPALGEPALGEPASGQADPRRGRFRARLLVVPLMLFVASRVAQLAVVAWMAEPGESIRSKLLVWDAGFFVKMIEAGYPSELSYDANGDMIGNALAFFPGYPMLARSVHLVGMDASTAALTVGWVAGALATLAVYALGAELYNHRVGVVLSVLFCTQPMSIVLSMAYSEALFVFFSAAALVAAHRRSWLVAGAFGLASALTRPTGAALAVAITVAAIVYVGRGGDRPWRALCGACLALAGVPAYLLWVGQRVGEWDGWFQVQTAGWGTTFDFGATTLTFIHDALRAGDGWVQVSVAWLLIAAVFAAGVAVARRVWPPLIVYGVLVLILVVGQSGYYHSKPRLLVPALLILVPAAVALTRSRRTSTAVLALVAYAAFGLWYGSYLVTVWRYAI